MRIAAELIAGYPSKTPFHLWLQDIFRQHKQFGSKDRKFYREAFYGYWRLGDFGSRLTPEQRILAGLIRIHPDNSAFSDILPDLFPGIKPGADFEEIERFTGEIWEPYKPFKNRISDKINPDKLNTWFGQKAPVWLRINLRHREELLAYLIQRTISYEEYGRQLLKTGHENLDDIIIKGWCRIQDLGSQESLNEEILCGASLIWDACSGAGGKALLVSEINPEATLYISDTRSQMVHNALQRFSAEGKPQPFSGTADLSIAPKSLIFDDKINITKPVFDTIICDVPCTGSGTWRRNPEMLSVFSESDLDHYSKRQRQIIKNALTFLKPGGKLIYLTCSVFSAENELNALYLQEKTDLKIVSEKYCGGYEKDADFIYRAIFTL